MLLVAIIEDAESDREILTEYLNRYGKEKKQEFQVRCFSSALSFINDDEKEFDIVLMDILMPEMNGMEAANKLREVNESACLIFVTNMSEYAVEGYQVNAMDYLLKPVKFPRFVETMDKAVQYCTLRRHHVLSFQTAEGLVRLNTADIFFIQSYKHYLYIQTLSDEYRVRSSMKEMEQQLSDQLFFRCDNSYIINLEHVSEIKRDTAVVGQWNVPVSRMRRKDFVNAFTCYLGELD